MSTMIMWALSIAALGVALELGRAALREWFARRRVIRRGRTLTAKYGMPWR